MTVSLSVKTSVVATRRGLHQLQCSADFLGTVSGTTWYEGRQDKTKMLEQELFLILLTGMLVK